MKREEGQPEVQLTEIQELLNGERGGREFGVVLDLVVGVLQQRPEQPHVDSADSGLERDDDWRSGRTRLLHPRRSWQLSRRFSSSLWPLALRISSLAADAKPECCFFPFFILPFFFLLISKRTGYITDIEQRTEQGFLSLVCIAQTSRSKSMRNYLRRPKCVLPVLSFKIIVFIGFQHNVACEY